MTHAILYWRQAEEKHKKIENVEFSVGGSINVQPCCGLMLVLLHFLYVIHVFDINRN